MHQHISIIGSGFCGTALAVQLLNHARGPLHVQLINRSGRLARGLAYGTRSTSHLLNVPAGRMSLFPERHDDFLLYAQSKLPSARMGDFLPRSLYGDYLEQRLAEAIACKSPVVSFEHVVAQVIDIDMASDQVVLTLLDGRRLESTQAVIATGNFAPAVPAPLASIASDSRFIRDPWRPHALGPIERNARVLLIGTGLTMLDVALALQDQGHNGTLQAFSRRALLPQAHRSNLESPNLPAVPDSLLRRARTRHLLSGIRAYVRAAQRDGYDWREALAALRPATPMLWQQLDSSERRRFLRHLQPYWEVHRHRAAPKVSARIEAMLQHRHLEVVAGCVRTAKASEEALILDLKLRGKQQTKRFEVDHIINCTGPCSDLTRLDEPLLNSLHARGVVRRDDEGLGVEATADYRLIGRDNDAHERLFLLSPMLRARYWEATAVPELRQHAARLAELLLSGDQTN
ncbi:FAD/NAD(P)-binding protein [Pseudomonas sp. JS3066]|uniref:FAD/NAD(P)-binding protein n=1 Tax=unclassified Pseudomonas TaxID=196821 RepID=UPI0013C5166F|nr:MULTISPECIES: FAD/NAD(P)-binding protein [unclassified Pseudomonas]WVK91201.1 FAD/NAD(P)-binding protein [Pseudomonas sp. JS3066]